MNFDNFEVSQRQMLIIIYNNSNKAVIAVKMTLPLKKGNCKIQVK